MRCDKIARGPLLYNILDKPLHIYQVQHQQPAWGYIGYLDAEAPKKLILLPIDNLAWVLYYSIGRGHAPVGPD